MKGALRPAGRAAAGMLLLAVLAQLGMPGLAAVVILTVLGLGIACWIISSDDRTGRVNRMMLARQGNARCLDANASAVPPPAPRPSRENIRPRRNTANAPADRSAA
jgi:hypothetical protein